LKRDGDAELDREDRRDENDACEYCPQLDRAHVTSYFASVPDVR
jgi:hypothetical protein